MVLVVAIRATDSRHTFWHGLILVALSGTLTLALSADLLTLALGSALIDLALIGLAASAPGDGGRVVWRMVVPGVASTLVLFAGALRLDADVGSPSLLVRDLPSQILLLVGIAGTLRLLVFPLHPRGLATPETAATLLLPLGAGVLLLDHAQVVAPILADQPWLVALGGAALVAGGLLAWADGGWAGIAVHQTGLALLAVVLRASASWSLASLALVLGILAVWWDVQVEAEALPRAPWQERVAGWLARRWGQVRAAVAARLPWLRRWWPSWLGRRAGVFLVGVALISLAGAPLTAGAVGRWSLYATLLGRQESILLPLTLAADTLLVAGLWRFLDTVLQQGSERKAGPSSLAAMLFLAMLIVVLGVAPGRVGGSLGLTSAERPDVSVWGLGFVYIVPWLLGTWLAHLRLRLERYLDLARRVLSLDRFYRAASVVGNWLVGAVYWLSRVGEGEGWWGWALIILAVGAVLIINP